MTKVQNSSTSGGTRNQRLRIGLLYNTSEFRGAEEGGVVVLDSQLQLLLLGVDQYKSVYHCITCAHTLSRSAAQNTA